MDTTTQLGDSGNNDPETNYLMIALAAGIPCGFVIVVLTAVIVFMVCLTLRRSSEQDQVEATYMQRRFQGLSLAEQRRMEEQKRKKKKRFVSRRRSSAAESKASSTKLSPSTRRAKVRRVNPFGLQDWQLRMSGIEPETEETDIDGEEESERTVGAFNPLMMRDDTDFQPEYEPSNRSHIPHKRTPPHVEAAATVSLQTPSSSVSDSSDSSDSMNPYD